MTEWTSDIGMIRTLVAYNGSGADIPPFGVVELQSYSIGDDDTDSHFTAIKPTVSSSTVAIAFNGPVTLPDGEYGNVSMDLPNWAAVNPGGEGSGIAGSGSGSDVDGPGAGEEWGVEAGSWYLSRNETGFRVLGFDPDEDGDWSAPRVMVVITAPSEGDTPDGSGSGSGSGTGCEGISVFDLFHCNGDQMEDRCLVMRGGRLTVLDSDGNEVASV